MPSFGTTSRERLDTCHDDLSRLFERVVQIVDCKILEGHRNQLRQQQMFDEGKSKVVWPYSKHNQSPSMAVDVAPWPIPTGWHPHGFIHLAGVVRGIAAEMGIKIRWGGDWDGDFNLMDQTFNDLVHFELMEV